MGPGSGSRELPGHQSNNAGEGGSMVAEAR